MRELSQRMGELARSRSVTEILRLAERDDVISFAGGLPDPAVFDLKRVRESMERVLRDEGAAALNYGPNAGFTKLREWIAARMGTKENVSLTPDNILVVSGGVEGMNLAAMAMLDRGDTVLVESPTYMVALHIYHAYQARIETVATDDDGLSPDDLEARLAALARDGVTPKQLYVIPSFQNPSGRTMSLERRHRTVELCRRYGVTIVEDHAYAELAYDGERLPSLKALDPDNVVLVHTFSKIFGPGVRLGWVASEPAFIGQLGLCKHGTDQCANTLAQRLVFDYGRHGFIDDQVAASIDLYRRKRDMMISAMRTHLPEEVSWGPCGGGFFVWARLGAGGDSEQLLQRAIADEKTAFVAGPPFFADGSGSEYLRLSFSFVAENAIDDGIARLARAIAASIPDRARP